MYIRQSTDFEFKLEIVQSGNIFVFHWTELSHLIWFNMTRNCQTYFYVRLVQINIRQ